MLLLRGWRAFRVATRKRSLSGATWEQIQRVSFTNRTHLPGGTVEVIPFVETEYLPHVISTLSASTVAGYKKLWRAYRRYVEPSTLEMRPCEAQNILRSIALNNPHLGSRSLSHTKALFSGIWSFAVCMGVVDS